MAETVLRTAVLRTHLHSLVRDLLTLIPSKSVRRLHGQKKLSAFLLVTGNPSQRQSWCSGASKSCANLNARYITGYSLSALSAQVITSCVINCGLRRRNSIASHGDVYISPSCYMQVRQKSKNRQQDDNSEAEDSDENDELDDDDFDAPPSFKMMKMHVSSTRVDGVVSNALDISRNNLEEIFLSSGLYLNGSKLLKKAEKMDIGDYIDLVVEKADDQLKVKRVKVLKIYPEKTSKEKFILKVRVWKTPFLIATPEK